MNMLLLRSRDFRSVLVYSSVNITLLLGRMTSATIFCIISSHCYGRGSGFDWNSQSTFPAEYVLLRCIDCHKMQKLKSFGEGPILLCSCNGIFFSQPDSSSLKTLLKTRGQWPYRLRSTRAMENLISNMACPSQLLC